MTELDYKKERALRAARIDKRSRDIVAISVANFYGETLDDFTVAEMMNESPEINKIVTISDPNNGSLKWTPLACARHNIVASIREYILASLPLKSW